MASHRRHLAVLVAVLLCLGARGGCILPCSGGTPAHTEAVMLDAGVCPSPLSCSEVCSDAVATCDCTVDMLGRVVVICNHPAQPPPCGD